MHVLIVQPRIHDFAAFDLWNRPLGWLNLAAHLEAAGARVELIDALDRFQPLARNLPRRKHRLDEFGCGHYYSEEIEKPGPVGWVPRRFQAFGLPLDRVCQLIEDCEKPDIVLTGCTMTYWYPGVIGAVKLVRDRWPQTAIGVAGIYAILCANHAREHTGADFVYSGSVFTGLLAQMEEITGISLSKPSAQEFITPAYRLMSDHRSLPLQLSCGCPYRCTYCASHLLSPRYRKRNPDAVVGMMSDCAERWGTIDWAFYDDALLHDRDSHFMPTMDLIEKRPCRWRFHTPNALHCRMIDDRCAEIMLRCGFETIRLGLEFTDPETQAATGDKVNWKEYETALEHLFHAGFRREQIGTYVMALYPGQKPADLLESCRRVFEAGSPIRLAMYSPIPGTVDFARERPDWRFDPSDDPLLQNPSLAPYRSRDFPFEEYQQIKRQVNRWNRGLVGKE